MTWIWVNMSLQLQGKSWRNVLNRDLNLLMRSDDHIKSLNVQVKATLQRKDKAQSKFQFSQSIVLHD